MSFTLVMHEKAVELAKVSTHELNAYTAQGESYKNAYLSLGRSVLRAVGKHYRMVGYKVHVNRAGIAVSGDITLIGMFDDEHGLYIRMSEPALFGGTPEFLFRSVKHTKDYTGGGNQYMTYDELASDLELACEKMARLVGARR
jgi:hypothetical protein